MAGRFFVVPHIWRKQDWSHFGIRTGLISARRSGLTQPGHIQQAFRCYDKIACCNVKNARAKHPRGGSAMRPPIEVSVRRLVLECLLVTFVIAHGAVAHGAEIQRRVIVFAEDGKFAGWPAGHGIWSWGNEILVGFSIGTFKQLEVGHDMDREKPEHHVLARSLDGGGTWRLERPADRGMLVHKGGMRKGTTAPSLDEPAPKTLDQPIHFTHPDFCMTLRLFQINGGLSRLYHSDNRGRDWRGPFLLPDFQQPGVMARTDYLVNSDRDCHIFVTVAKQNGREGRVLCARTLNGGLEWRKVGFVGDREPAGFSIMPSTVRLGSDTLVMATRRRSGDQRRRWIDVWSSSDNGQHWQFLTDAVDDLGSGNPPSLIRLRDGRLCLTYGVRKAPYEICAKLSGDDGATWSERVVLRTGGGGPDVGYTRTIQRPDGVIVTVYYYVDGSSPFPRIEAVLWSP